MREIVEIGNLVNTGNWESPQRGRIYSPLGISPALNTCGGGGLEPKIAYEEREPDRQPSSTEAERIQ